jgi:uncharacterized Tic20 family protein
MTENQPLPVYDQPQTQTRLSPSEERSWAMLAHLSVLINLVTGALGPIAALLIYLIYKDRSRYVAYQSLQSLLLQLIGWVGGGLIVGAAWAITGALSAILIGLCLIPFALIITLFLPVGTIVYSIIGCRLPLLVDRRLGTEYVYWIIYQETKGAMCCHRSFFF